jgi:hypothetical protein
MLQGSSRVAWLALYWVPDWDRQGPSSVQVLEVQVSEAKSLRPSGRMSGRVAAEAQSQVG